MTELDDKIRETLREQFGEDDFADGADAAVFDLVIDTFRGRNRWLTYLGVTGGVVVMGVSVFAAMRFFRAGDTRSMILWATIFLASFFAVGIMKVWFWMQMDKNAMMRELKRIELRIARIAARG